MNQRRIGRYCVAGILAASVSTMGGALAQPRIVPAVPNKPPAPPTTLPPRVPLPTPSVVVMPQSPLGNGPIAANKLQTKRPNIEIARPTPAVAMVVARDARHAAFEGRPLAAVITGRAAVPAAPLPVTLGASGPALKAGAKVVVDTDGRVVSAGEYRQDADVLEDYLNARGITQRSKEPGRKLREMKRQIARSKLPPPSPTVLRATNVPSLAPAPGNVAFPAARARRLAEARAELWSSGETVTLDRYTSMNEVRRPPPIRAQPPLPPLGEIDRAPQTATWFYKSGGDVGLDVDSNATYGAGKTLRVAGATMDIQGRAAGLTFPLFKVAATVTSKTDHTFDAATKTFGASGTASTKEGSFEVVGITVPGSLADGKAPPSWEKDGEWGASAAAPVGPFLAELKLKMGYKVGATTNLEIADRGLAVNASVGPRFGAYAELTAGIGLLGFSVGVGGHLALLAGKSVPDGTFTRKSFSGYSPDGWTQKMGANIAADVYALNGNLFVFVDTWWDRYDTELFAWTGIDLVGPDTAAGAATSIDWGTQQEPDYGPLLELRAFACRQNHAGVPKSFPHDWTLTTRTRAEMVANGCDLIPPPNDVVFGKLASKPNPDTVPIAECRMETAWDVIYGKSAPGRPIGNTPYVINDYTMALYAKKAWTGPPLYTEEKKAGEIECGSMRVGNGQRATFVRIAGYGWRAGGEVLLNARTKATTSTIPTYRCSARNDWYLQTQSNETLCPRDAGDQYAYRVENESGALVPAPGTNFFIATP